MKPTLQEDIRHALNCHSAEGKSGTPDFILAEYLINCLYAWDRAIFQRNEWYAGLIVSGVEKVAIEYCTYPDCNCPADAPADLNWCLRGLKRKNDNA